MSESTINKLKIFVFISALVLSGCVQDNKEKEFLNDLNQLLETAEWVPMTDLFEQVERRILIEDSYTYVSLSPFETAAFCDGTNGNTTNYSFQTLKMTPKGTAKDRIIVGMKFQAFLNDMNEPNLSVRIKQNYYDIYDESRVMMVFGTSFNELFGSPNDSLNLQFTPRYEYNPNFTIHYKYTGTKKIQMIEPSLFTIGPTRRVNEQRWYTVDEIYFKAVTKEAFQQVIDKYEAYDEEWSYPGENYPY
jgi:hypothetical protein